MLMRLSGQNQFKVSQWPIFMSNFSWYGLSKDWFLTQSGQHLGAPPHGMVYPKTGSSPSLVYIWQHLLMVWSIHRLAPHPVWSTFGSTSSRYGISTDWFLIQSGQHLGAPLHYISYSWHEYSPVYICLVCKCISSLLWDRSNLIVCFNRPNFIFFLIGPTFFFLYVHLQLYCFLQVQHYCFYKFNFNV